MAPPSGSTHASGTGQHPSGPSVAIADVTDIGHRRVVAITHAWAGPNDRDRATEVTGRPDRPPCCCGPTCTTRNLVAEAARVASQPVRRHVGQARR